MPTYHFAPFVLNVITASHPFIIPLVVFPKALFLALYFSSCTLPLSVLWYLLSPLTTTITKVILSSSFLSTHSTLTQTFPTFKTLFNRSLPGWLLIFLLLTPLRLNSCSSDSETNLPKYRPTTLHLTPPTLLEILASIFDEHLSFSDQITSHSKACYCDIRQLRCIRPYLDSSTACIIATSPPRNGTSHDTSMVLPTGEWLHI